MFKERENFKTPEMSKVETAKMAMDGLFAQMCVGGEDNREKMESRMRAAAEKLG